MARVFSGGSPEREGSARHLVTLSVYGTEESSISKKVLASGQLTAFVSYVALAHSTGLCPVFRCSGRLFSHFEVHA